MRNSKTFRLLIVASFLVGLSMTMGAWVWYGMQTVQTEFYNRGLIAYTIGDYDLANNDFDLSYADYNARLAATAGYTMASPSLEQAELSQEHKALALVKMKQTKTAVLAYKQCLLLTTDVYMSDHQNQILIGGGSSQEIASEYAKIKDDRKDCQIDLEILFHNQPALSDAQGQGQGAGSQQPGGDQTSEDPSNGAGQQDRSQVNN